MIRKLFVYKINLFCILHYFFTTYSALGGEFDRDINEFMTELAKQVKRIKVFNEILNFYMDYQSWFEEFHLTEYVEEATGDLK